jgi:hypothetical protein
VGSSKFWEHTSQDKQYILNLGKFKEHEKMSQMTGKSKLQE